MRWSSGFLLVVAPALLVTAGSLGTAAPAGGQEVAPPAPAEADPSAPVPVVGDFDADQRADLLWYGPGRSDDHLWFGAAGRRFAGQPVAVRGDYRPLTGDFNGDDHDDIFWYGSGPSSDYAWFGATGRRFVGREATVTGTYQPFSADFDGDRRDDIYWYHPGPGADLVWYGTPNGSFSGRSVRVSGAPTPVVGDFDGNGTADILWYGGNAAPDSLWQGRRTRGFTGRAVEVGPSVTPRVGDFDGDRRDDIFWFGPGAAADVVWYGADNGSFRGAGVTSGSAQAPAPGDLNGDGVDDLLWHQPGPAPDEAWYGHPTGFSVTAREAPAGAVPILADFDGNRATDVLWYAAGALPDPLWYGAGGDSFTSKSSIVDIHPALAPPVDRRAVASDYDRHGLLAHAMGPTPEGASYTNSLESFDHNFGRGFRVFEADFVRLADGSMLAAHDGLERSFGLDRRFSEVTRADMAGRRFRARNRYYTPFFSDDVVELMRRHPDVYLVLDTKGSDVALFAQFLRDAAGDPAVMERVIPHIYDQAQLDQVQDLYPVHSFMVALYRSQHRNLLDDDDAVAFTRRNRAPAVMMWAGTRNPALSLAGNMSERRRYTDPFAGRLRAAGAVAYVHSIRDAATAAAFKSKGVAIYSDGPFPPYSEAQPEVFAPGYEAVDQLP